MQSLSMRGSENSVEIEVCSNILHIYKQITYELSATHPGELKKNRKINKFCFEHLRTRQLGDFSKSMRPRVLFPLIAMGSPRLIVGRDSQFNTHRYSVRQHRSEPLQDHGESQ